MAHLRAMAKLVRDAGTAKLAFAGNDASAYGCPKNALGLGGGFRRHRRCWRSRPDLGERWPCRLVATATVNPLQLILDSERPDPICYRPSTISVSRRANARDIASRNRKTALANRISIPAILATLHDSTPPRHLMNDDLTRKRNATSGWIISTFRRASAASAGDASQLPQARAESRPRAARLRGPGQSHAAIRASSAA
jgi:hypothetical protein